MELIIGHLYPDLLNIYSDMGNIICLSQRCHWRGIKVTIKAISLKQKLEWQKYDLLFGGGGQDRQQLIVSQDLQTKALALREAAQSNLPMLTTCGSYQLFGHYFKTAKGIKIPGISIFDAYTIASQQRQIGNIVIKLNNPQKFQSFSNNSLKQTTLVGFENHSGKTYLSKTSRKTQTLGQVIKGFGNNGEDGTEGAIYKNVVGTYLHGPVLPKNPHLADWLIKTALERKYQRSIKLQALDDQLEWQAHQAAIKLAKKGKIW